VASIWSASLLCFKLKVDPSILMGSSVAWSLTVDVFWIPPTMDSFVELHHERYPTRLCLCPTSPSS